MKQETTFQESITSLLSDIQASLVLLALIVFSLLNGGIFIYYLIGISFFIALHAIIKYRMYSSLKNKIDPSFFCNEKYLQYRIQWHKNAIRAYSIIALFIALLLLFTSISFKNLLFVLLFFCLAYFIFDFLKKKEFESKLKSIT